jgi:hypothetical protein
MPSGSRLPLAARSSAMVVEPAGALQYSTHCWNSSGEPVPTLAAKYGSTPQSRQNRRNSWVPN